MAGRFLVLRAILLAAFLSAVLPSSACGQSLRQIRKDVRRSGNHKVKEEKKAKPKRRHHRHSRDGHCDDDDDDGWNELLGRIFFVGATSPFWAPRSALDDDSFDPGTFARYPYLHGMDGYMSTKFEHATDEYPWLLRLRTEYLSNLNNYSRVGGQVLFDTACRLGIDSEFNYHNERSPQFADRLWTGDVNLLFRFAQSRKMQLRTGIGLNWLSDEIGTDTGFNFTYSGDWFPRDPWIISMEIDWGKLGAATLFHGRVTAGVQFHRFEIYTGYDYFDLGSTEINSLISGLRLWY